MICEQAALLSPVDMMIVMAVALVVFGPSKLPEVGRQLGQAIRELKKLTSELTDSIQNETSGIRNAFDTTSPYEPKKGPIDSELKQSASEDGYSNAKVNGTDVGDQQKPVNAQAQPIGQAAAALVPLKATGQTKAGDEAQ